MKLGRACAAGAVLWAVALPLTVGTALADQPAPVADQPSEPVADPSAAPSEVAPDGRGPAADEAPREPQVAVRPEGAPETGGGPVETGVDPAVTGGAAAVVAVAVGGAVLVRRRHRAGAR
jgi:MYXO-CTERM domain-containing protein